MVGGEWWLSGHFIVLVGDLARGGQAWVTVYLCRERTDPKHVGTHMRVRTELRVSVRGPKGKQACLLYKCLNYHPQLCHRPPQSSPDRPEQTARSTSPPGMPLPGSLSLSGSLAMLEHPPTLACPLPGQPLQGSLGQPPAPVSVAVLVHPQMGRFEGLHDLQGPQGQSAVSSGPRAVEELDVTFTDLLQGILRGQPGLHASCSSDPIHHHLETPIPARPAELMGTCQRGPHQHPAR